MYRILSQPALFQGTGAVDTERIKKDGQKDVAEEQIGSASAHNMAANFWLLSPALVSSLNIIHIQPYSEESKFLLHDILCRSACGDLNTVEENEHR